MLDGEIPPRGKDSRSRARQSLVPDRESSPLGGISLSHMNESINLHLSNVSPVAVQYNALKKLDR